MTAGTFSSPARHVRAALLLLLPLLAGACAISRATVNRPLFENAVAQLRPGTTTAAQVVELLGAPADVVQLGRRSAYRYEYQNTKRAGLVAIVLFLWNVDTRSDRVWVFFDEGDVLTHVGATLEGDDGHYALPWVDIH